MVIRRVAVLGLGEAGSRLAADLLQLGVEVAGWDPVVRDVPSGVRLAVSNLEAVADADLVLSANAAAVAVEVGRSVAYKLGGGVLYADVNTAAPAIKERLGEVFEKSRASFVDVAMMAPIARAGIRTPCLASGPGAEAFKVATQPFGTPVTVVDDRPGTASRRKLLRSIFTKGMGAAAVEAMEAARALGCEDWLYQELAAELEAHDARHLDRLLEGNRIHARRRIDEMTAAADLVRGAGIEPFVTEAARRLLERLAAQTAGESAPGSGGRRWD